ncbi:MAG: dienelactone hydrolase family protein [Gemmatimonadaceae bacterium]|nr:dienelactone hydrolase family protein [Chitinophagaceae bacterium]
MRGIAVHLCIVLTIFASSCSKDVETDPDRPININDQVETEPPVLIPAAFRVNDQIGGYYVSRPANYTQTTKRYPLIIFIPGAGQFGNGSTDLPLLLNDGIPKMVNENKFPANFKVNGKNFSFITITPQLSSFPNGNSINDILAYASATLRVDPARIYVAGLSIGGTVGCTMAADNSEKIAAVVPMAGVDYTYEVCKKLADTKMPVWVFHNEGDPTTPVSQANEFISRFNAYQPQLAPRITIFKSFGHDAWTQATSADYKENNMNIYEWMLQYSK